LALTLPRLAAPARERDLALDFAAASKGKIDTSDTSRAKLVRAASFLSFGRFTNMILSLSYWVV
jgi:hypothetical protein